jgi:hypothetical protein
MQSDSERLPGLHELQMHQFVVNMSPASSGNQSRLNPDVVSNGKSRPGCKA